MTVRLTIDQSGTLEIGYFYSLGLFKDEDLSNTDSWYLKDLSTILQRREELKPKDAKRGESWFWFEDCTNPSEGEKIDPCPIDRSHATFIHTDSEVDVFAGPFLSPISPDEKWFINTALMKQIEMSKMRGSDLRKVHIKVNQTDYPDPELYIWQFRGKRISRAKSVVGGKNVCPYCGNEPVICPGCSVIVNNPCKKCKEWTLQNIHAKRDFDESRIQFDLQELQKTVVLEGNRWDGCDVLGDSIVTKRVVDFLLKVHAAPFSARPIRVCTDGMNDEQKKWLDEATKPL